jgi:hypothetical protein
MKNSQLPVRIVTVLFAVCALASTKLATAGEAAPAKAAVAPNVKSALPDKAIPQGIGFKVHIMGPDRDWDEIKAAGVEFIRTDFSWDRIEHTKGQYDFDAYDRMLESLEARGIRVDFGLQYRNKLYPYPETTEEGRDAYARWAAASVRHFKGRNVMWEIWNEPNVDFWKGKGEMNSAEFASEYMALVKKAVSAMRAADPDCFILGGAVSCLWVKSFQWIDEVFKQGLLKTGINALSVHPYGFSRPELCVESGRPDQGYAPLREKMEKIGAKDFPVVNSEVGYATGQNTTLEHQAMLFVRTCLLDRMCDIRMTIWYNWDEHDANSHRVRSSGPDPLPVDNACKNMVAELSGYHYAERLKVGSDIDYVLAFENASGGRKIVAWTTPQKQDVSPDKAKAKAHDLAIPTGGAGNVAVRDLYGKNV